MILALPIASLLGAQPIFLLATSLIALLLSSALLIVALPLPVSALIGLLTL